jgi:hypothetical protein
MGVSGVVTGGGAGDASGSQAGSRWQAVVRGPWQQIGSCKVKTQNKKSKVEIKKLKVKVKSKD